MKKTVFIIFLIITLLSFYGCSLFSLEKHPPEIINPEVLVSGDVQTTQIIHTQDLAKTNFDKEEGYALADFLNKITLLHQNYDVMALSRDGKAVRIEGDTVQYSYLIEKKGGVLELYSSVHYNFENSFLPLSGVSELVVLAQDDVLKGIPIRGGNTGKMSTSTQIELLYKQLRACESNGKHIIKEYSKEIVEANILLGNAESAVIEFSDKSTVTVYKDTKDILDWKRGNLILRSSSLPIISISL